MVALHNPSEGATQQATKEQVCIWLLKLVMVVVLSVKLDYCKQYRFQVRIFVVLRTMNFKTHMIDVLILAKLQKLF